eukprot:269300-Pelagomonas_calceolata.AAC.3
MRGPLPLLGCGAGGGGLGSRGLPSPREFTSTSKMGWRSSTCRYTEHYDRGGLGSRGLPSLREVTSTSEVRDTAVPASAQSFCTRILLCMQPEEGAYARPTSRKDSAAHDRLKVHHHHHHHHHQQFTNILHDCSHAAAAAAAAAAARCCGCGCASTDLVPSFLQCSKVCYAAQEAAAQGGQGNVLGKGPAGSSLEWPGKRGRHLMVLHRVCAHTHTWYCIGCAMDGADTHTHGMVVLTHTHGMVVQHK